MDILDPIKVKNLCPVKTDVRRMKASRKQAKMFKLHVQQRTRICNRQISKFNSKKQTILMEDGRRHITKEDI